MILKKTSFLVILLGLFLVQVGFTPKSFDTPLTLKSQNITPKKDEVLIEGTAEPNSEILLTDAVYQYQQKKMCSDAAGNFAVYVSADVVPHYYFVTQGNQTLALTIQPINKETTAEMQKLVAKNREAEKEKMEKATSYYDLNPFAQILPERKTYEAAHRGLESQAPENTLTAFQKAAKAKYPLVESDAQVTKDGHWVIMHDRKVNRTTDGHGYVRKMDFKDFRKLQINHAEAVTKPPTVYEYLKTTKKNKAMPLLEIKTANYSDEQLDELVTMIRELNLEEHMAMISFDESVLTRIHLRMPKMPLIYLFSDAQAPNLDNTIEWCKQQGIAGLGFRKDTLTQEVVDKCHNNGLIVDVYTIKNVLEQQAMANLGVDLITSSSLPE